MSEQSESPQAQSAVDQTREAILGQIAEAELSGAPTEELVKSLAATRTKAPEPAKAPEPEKPSEAPAETVIDEVPAETTEVEPAGDEPQVESSEEGEQNRFRFKNQEDRAIALLAKSKGWSLEETVLRVSGEPPQSIPGTEQIQPVAEIVPDVAALLAQVEADKARLMQIKEERLKLKANPDLYGEVVELDNEQADIVTRLIDPGDAIAQARADARLAQNAAQALEDQKQVVLAELAKTYPEVIQEDTAHFMLAQQIAAKVRNNPNHPDHALSRRAEFVNYCAEEAAKLLGKTAKSPNAAPAAKSPVTPKAEVKQPSPASGSRASAPATPAKTAKDIIAELDAQIEGGISPNSRRSISPSGRYIG